MNVIVVQTEGSPCGCNSVSDQKKHIWDFKTKLASKYAKYRNKIRVSRDKPVLNTKPRTRKRRPRSSAITNRARTKRNHINRISR